MDHQPRPGVPAQKGARDRLIRLAERHPDWVLGFQDEVWWSRLARPDLHAWAGDEPMRLRQLEAGKDDPDPKALACYGLLRGDTGGMMPRFVAGRPVSRVTEDFLAWACERLAAEVAFAEGITARLVSDETIRQALIRLGIGWKRAKTWITSPDPAYLRKKGRATG